MSLYELLNLNPNKDKERSKYDDRAVIEAVRRNPNDAKRKHTFSAYSNNYEYYPLNMAVMLGCSLEAAEALYEANPHAIQHTTGAGYTVLHTACRYKVSLDVATFLVDKNPSALEMKTKYGETPLHSACYNGAPLEVVGMLLERYPPALHIKTKRGNTPLMWAKKRNASPEVIALLEKAEAAAASSSSSSLTPVKPTAAATSITTSSTTPSDIGQVKQTKSSSLPQDSSTNSKFASMPTDDTSTTAAEDSMEQQQGSSSSLSIPRSICIIAKRLRLGRSIGEGAFGEVFEGTYSRRDGNIESVAFKQFRIKESELSEDDTTSIERELDVLRCFQLHENVVTLLGACSDSGATDANGRKVGFGAMLELAELGSLREYLVKCKLGTEPKAALSILLDVAQGMLALHSHRPHPIIHRDLKSMNVLLFSKPSQAGIVAKISDFGLARAVTDSSAAATTEGVGTARWMAPETFFGEKCTVRSDVWSFGMVIYEVATCRIPYFDFKQHQLYHKMTKKELPDLSKVRSSFPDSVSALMKECCNFEAKKRPRFGAIVERLSDLLGEEQPTFHSVRAGSVEERLELQRKLRELKEQLDKQAVEDAAKYKEAWESLSAKGETAETLRILSKFAVPRLATPCQPKWISSIDDLVADAEACYQDMQDTMRSLVEHAGGEFLDAPLKKRDRIEHKVSKDYDGDCRCVVDVVRATGLFESLSQVKDIVELLENSESLTVIRCKDRLNHPLKSGYRDVLLNVVERKSDGPSHVAELQLHLRSIKEIKPFSHRVYELQRLAGWVLE